MPTIGDDPKKEVLKEISKLRELGINVSLIGINLDEESEELSKEIANIGKGRFFVVRDIEELDTIILDDYYSFR
jgi:Mg-chelatase subunit ChlD